MNRSNRSKVGMAAVLLAGCAALTVIAARLSWDAADSPGYSDSNPGLVALAVISHYVSIFAAGGAFVLGVQTLLWKGNVLLGLIGTVLSIAVGVFGALWGW